jgi:hypothetical protein
LGAAFGARGFYSVAEPFARPSDPVSAPHRVAAVVVVKDAVIGYAQGAEGAMYLADAR